MNTTEQRLLEIWEAISTGQQTKMKDAARESYLALVNSLRPHVVSFDFAQEATQAVREKRR